MTGDLEFLRRAFRDVPMCHLSTLDPAGAPHVAPRWFVWVEEGLFISTRRGDASWENVVRDPRVSVVMDRGRDWAELTGVRVDGAAGAVAAEHPEIRGVMSAWHEKYRSMFSGTGSSGSPARWRASASSVSRSRTPTRGTITRAEPGARLDLPRRRA